jgi:hypothetical protein
VVDLPGLGEGQDVVDWAPGRSIREFFAALDAAWEWKLAATSAESYPQDANGELVENLGAADSHYQGTKDAPPDADSDEPWWRDQASIPPRGSLYGRHYVRNAIGATIAGGGRGKTSLGSLEAVSMAVGRNLLTGERLPGGPLRVVLWNGEEDQDEMDRRIAAVCQRYKITKDDLDGRLFVKSVTDKPMRFAVMDKGAAKIDPAVFERAKQFGAFTSE